MPHIYSFNMPIHNIQMPNFDPKSDLSVLIVFEYWSSVYLMNLLKNDAVRSGSCTKKLKIYKYKKTVNKLKCMIKKHYHYFMLMQILEYIR